MVQMVQKARKYADWKKNARRRHQSQKHAIPQNAAPAQRRYSPLGRLPPPQLPKSAA